MGTRTMKFSDISNKLVDDEGAIVRIVVEQHPALEDGPVEIEAITDEVEPIRKGALDVVMLKLYEGDGTEPETVIMEVDAFNKLAGDMDMADVIRRAEPAYAPRRKKASTASSGAVPSTEKIYYSDLDHAGSPHRGRITDAEKETVRNNLEAINERLQRDGIRTIDLDNAEHVQRYGLEALAKEAGYFQQ
ncbi:MAG: hypothetical protein LC775_00985 [Acidobacteria bacterium]|nr:hypothetical protein [Acidobacteriota bacterium]